MKRSTCKELHFFTFYFTLNLCYGILITVLRRFISANMDESRKITGDDFLILITQWPVREVIHMTVTQISQETISSNLLQTNRKALHFQGPSADGRFCIHIG